MLFKTVYTNFISFVKLILLPVTFVFVAGWHKYTRNKVWSWTIRIVQWSVMIYVLELVGAALLQNKILYKNWGWGLCHENEPGLRNPMERGIPYQEFFIPTKDNMKLHSWLMLQENPKSHPTLLYFKGNYRNIGMSLQKLEVYYRKLGLNILIADYRGNDCVAVWK